MSPTSFVDDLFRRIHTKGTPCVVGIDPALEKMPEDFLRERGLADCVDREACAEALFQYSRLILDAVCDLVPAVKPQSAYFERYGSAGVAALERTIAEAKERDLVVILDAKRGDIGSTADAYARGYLDESRIDAMTVSPYLGDDSLAPFFEASERTGKGIFVCVKTSNPGSGSLQDLRAGPRAIYEVVADFVKPAADRLVSGKHGYSGIGAVVGATYPEIATVLRRRLPTSLFLVPGIGAQGGSAETLRHFFDERGLGALVSSSRAINYPHMYGSASGTLLEQIRSATRQFKAQVQQVVEVRI